MTTGRTADAIVVGAGIIGCAIALELARAGRSVVVIDKAAGPGQGSTSASSAVVRFNFSTWAGVALAWEAKHCWEQWDEHLGIRPDGIARAHFRRTGLALLDVAALPRKRVLPLFDRVGVPYEEWDAATLAERVQGLDPGRFGPPRRPDDPCFWAEPDGRLGAVHTPDAGYVDDPQLAAENLAAAATATGVRFTLHATVVEVLRSPARVTGVRLADGSTIYADVVVNAAGPWSGRLNGLADVGGDFTIGLRPLRQEVHHVPAPAAALATTVADLDLGVYLRPDTGDGVLVGGTEPECDPLHWLDDPDDLLPRATKAVFDAQVLRAARRLPQLTVPDRPRGVVGVYDVAEDWTPIYDRTDLPGFYVAIGTSGNQFKNAPTVGQLMAVLIGAVEDGADHDSRPVRFTAPHTAATINLSGFSRRRPRGAPTSRSVLG